VRHLAERGESWTELGNVHPTFELTIEKIQP